MVSRPLVELVLAVVASALIGFGLTQALGGLGWEVALGIGLLLMALVAFGVPLLFQALPVKLLLVAAGVLLLLLPSFRI